MKIKAKHFLYVGAFIVLTIIGANFLPKEEVFILDDFDKNKIISGDDEEDYIYIHIDGAINSPRD